MGCCASQDKQALPNFPTTERSPKLDEEIKKFEQDLSRLEQKAQSLDSGMKDLQTDVSSCIKAEEAKETDRKDMIERFNKISSDVTEMQNGLQSETQDLKELRSSLNELKGLLNSQQSGLLTPDKIEQAQKDAKKIGDALAQLESQLAAKKKLLANLKSISASEGSDKGGEDILDEINQLLQALQGDKNDIQNALQGKKEQLGHLQKLNEAMQESPQVDNDALLEELTQKVNKLAILMEQIENESSKLSQALDDKEAQMEEIKQKGAKDRAYAAEQLDQVQMLANQREHLKSLYDQLKNTLSETKEFALENVFLSEKLTQVEEISSNFGDPNHMANLIKKAKSVLGGSSENVEDATEGLIALTEAFFFSVTHELQMKDSAKSQTMQSINDAVEEIENQISSLEEQKCTDPSLDEIKEALNQIKQDLVKFQVMSHEGGKLNSKFDLPDWQDAVREAEDQHQELIKLEEATHGLMDQVGNIRAPEPEPSFDSVPDDDGDAARTSTPTPISPEKPLFKKLVVAKNADVVDKMLIEAQNAVQGDISLVLIDKSKNLYQFGTKRVTCKVQNGKLLLRVGGGYMSFEEFYAEYADQERAKLARIAESEGSPDVEAEKKKKKKKKKGKKSKKKAENRYSDAGNGSAIDLDDMEGDEDYEEGDESHDLSHNTSAINN